MVWFRRLQPLYMPSRESYVWAPYIVVNSVMTTHEPPLPQAFSSPGQQTLIWCYRSRRHWITWHARDHAQSLCHMVSWPVIEIVHPVVRNIRRSQLENYSGRNSKGLAGTSRIQRPGEALSSFSVRIPNLNCGIFRVLEFCGLMALVLYMCVQYLSCIKSW